MLFYRRFGLIFSLAVLCFCLYQCSSSIDRLERVSYDPTFDNFSNPERGFYRFTRGIPGDTVLDIGFLRELRDQNFSLISRGYYIEIFRESDLSEEFIEQIEMDFQAMRETGIKAFLRFNYSRRIGDPDASLERVLAHLEQLRPVFERNYDVIAVIAAGFIGAWGEWHASTNNLETPENMRAVLFKLLDVLPEERTVVLRSPRHKMNIFETNHPFTAEQAFDGSYVSRSGHHNDCFLASPTDVGTYVVGRYPNYDLEDSISVDWIKNYLSMENRYLPMGGETCNPRPDAGDRFHCNTALQELAQLRWSFLNYNYSRQILDTWVEQGCMPDVERRLGYRFSMLEGTYSSAASPGGTFRFNLEMVNEGFAAPYNPRGLQVLLRSLDSPDQIWEVDLPDDPRYWLGGQNIRLSHELGLPSSLADGEYEVLLNLPDPAENLQNLPDYSIRIANTGTWEASTGFNRLNHRLIVDSSVRGRKYSGELTFFRPDPDSSNS